MVSFAICRSGSEIQIILDDAGIRFLIDKLTSLIGSGSHLHLRAPSEGGTDLQDVTPWNDPAVGEVIISQGGD